MLLVVKGLPPVLLVQLLDRDGLVSGGLLLDLVLVVLLADDLQVDLVLTRDVPLLLEQQCGVPVKMTILSCTLYMECFISMPMAILYLHTL